MKKLLPLIAAAGFGALAMTAPGFADHRDGDHKDGDHKNQSATDDGADPRIGKKVKSICFQSSINGWKAVKGEDDVVLLERGVNDWYRVELLGACPSRVFRSAFAIGIESRPAGGCVSRGDVIIVEDGPGFNRRCTITGIHEWNEDALEESEDEETDDEAGDV